MPRLLSKSQLAALRADIQLRHEALLVEVLGDHVVTPRVLRAIRKAGLYRPAKRAVFQTAYLFGRHAVADPKVADLPPAEFTAYLQRNRIRLDPAARKAIAKVEQGFATRVRELGQKMMEAVTQALRSAEHTLGAAPGLAARSEAAAQMVRSMVSVTSQQLAAATRLIESESNNAYQRGRQHEIQAKSGEDDPWVFKRPRHDSCVACKEAYLEKDGKTPRLFRLSALAANGTNVGRRRPERLPVIESLHPFCRCELNFLPQGFEFDRSGTMTLRRRKAAAHG